jgi:hypothetical protein
VLYGAVARGNPAPRGAGAGGVSAAAASVTADANALRMAPVGPRFAYLPVTTPAALLRQTSGLAGLAPARTSSQGELARSISMSGMLPAGSLAAAAAAAFPAAQAPAGQSAAAYSFASLVSLGGRARQLSGAAAEASAAASGQAGTGVGQGVSAAATKLVGLLGDTGTGLLSSFARGFNN